MTRTGNKSQEAYRLYGSFASLWTGKIRSYLRKKAIPFVEYLPCTPHFREHVTPHVGNKRIPVLEAPDGTIIQDSNEIFQYLEERFPEPPAVPKTPRQRLVAYLLELFAAESLGKVAWHFRWRFPEENLRFVTMDFGRSFRPQGSNEELMHYGGIIANRMDGHAAAIGLTEPLYPALVELYHEVLDILEAHFTSYPYLLGGLPSTGDFALMAPLFAHLGRDPYPLHIMQRRAPRVFRWVEHMNTPEIRMPEFSDTPQAYLPDDEVPESVARLLRMLIADFGSIFTSTAALYNEWTTLHSNAPPETPLSDTGADQPSIGRIQVHLRGHPYSCESNPHGLWILQRALDHYASFDDATRAEAQSLIDAMGAQPILDIKLNRPLMRANYRLAVR
jgi:glutathione S-transferase